jgi:hypothetical protein
MKKIKTLLILGAMVLIGLISQSQSITYRLNNYMVISGTPDTLVFDIEAKSNVTTTYATSFVFCMSFNNVAFGTGIPVSTELLPLAQPTGYNLNTVPTAAGSGRWMASFKAFPNNAPFSGTYDIAYLSNVTTTYQGVARYKMLITGSGPLNLDFYLALMTGQNKFVTSSGGVSTIAYTPVAKEAAVTAQTLLISEVGDPSNTTTNFVEIYNPGASALSLNYYPFYLNSGVSSVQLTGTIPAGGAYTVAYNNTDFTPNLVSTTVGTGGSTLYRLSFAGNYSTGTVVDAYDGTVSDFGYTGKHAVRHYNIVNPAVTPVLSEWVISAAQDIDMTPGSHRATLTWDGVPSSEWRLRSNWASALIPDAGHNVSIPVAGATPVISNGDNAYANDLSIAGGANLIIESLPGGDGSIITYGTVTGSASVQRYLGADRYWYVTKPVTSATANVFLHMWLFTYDGGAWTPFIYDETTPLNQMQGYAVWTSSINSWDPEIPPIGTTTTSYDGTLNSGTIGTSLETGWNFVGNPYASAANWDASGWTKTNLVSDGYLVWNGALGTNAQYIGGVGTNGASKDIHAAQGFFVEAAGAGFLGVTDVVRTHSTQAFLKDEVSKPNLLSMTISNGSVSDETVIYFSETATSELDYSFDAHKLMAEAAPQAYTMLGNDRMGINAFNNVSETSIVTLGVNAPEAGEYTLTASNLESFDGSIPVLLEDLLTGQKVDLRQMSTYSFSSEAGTSERFAIHFAEFQGIGDDVSTEVNSIYAVNQTVYVDFTAVKGDITIYNILGQEISRTGAINGLNLVSVPQGNAVYIVKVITDNSTVTKKVFVK